MLIFIIVLVVLFLYVISVYNSFVSSKQRVKEAWSTVETQLKRRYDLIPNLVEVVKGYAKHEKETLNAVISARNMAMSARVPSAKGQMENSLSESLKTIFALSESYPDLKANTNFLELQQELSDTENKIQASRQFYNSVVLSLNTKIQMFPGNIIARLFNFNKEAFFELDEEESKLVKKAPSVKF